MTGKNAVNELYSFILLTNIPFFLPQQKQIQIEKLLKVVNEDGAAGGDNLQFKPNPTALIGRGEGTEGDEGEGDGKYRPPKMLPTTMEDDIDGKEKSNKEKRREKEQRRRAQRSSLIKVRLCWLSIRFMFCYRDLNHRYRRLFALLPPGPAINRVFSGFLKMRIAKRD